MKISRRGLIPRAEYVRDARLFIIATEGTHTEKQYFEGLFGNSRLKIHVLDTGTTGYSDPGHVLDRLARFVEKYDLNDDDQRWLMVDVDRIRPQFMSSVCQEASQKSFKLAVSNPCFELWLVLHFSDIEIQQLDCKTLKKRMKSLLGSYNWSNLDLSHYSLDCITAAIERAKLLVQDSDERWPAQTGTHVFRVVELLLRAFRSTS